MIISKTPLRVSFAGGGTDLPSFYKKNIFGAVLSTSINSYLYVSIKKQNKLHDEKFRLNYSETELVQDVEKIKNPIMRECLKFLDIDDSLYISTISDIPAQTGLGSSSTFSVGLLNALYKYKGESIDSERLAEEAAHIEINVLSRPMGKQDHYAAALGGLNYIRFNNDDSVNIKSINLSNKSSNFFSKSVLMFWTGITRPSESVLKEQDENNINNSEILIKIRDQAEDLSNLFLSENFSIKEIGDLVNEGWRLKKELASGVSNPDIDNYYNLAMKNGAYGGKISGAGGGGFLNLISEPSKHDELITELSRFGLLNYSFGLDSKGTQVKEIF